MRTDTMLHIAFDDVGDGEPAVLFLPGWCTNRTMFRELLPSVGRHRRVIALDWRGHGGSDRPGHDFGYDELLDDALDVMHVAGAETIVPVGQSHGAWVAIELRRRLGPQRVPGIIALSWMVLGPPPGFEDALAGLQDGGAWESAREALLSRWSGGRDVPAVNAVLAEMAAYDFESWSRAGREIARRFAAEGSPVAALEELPEPCPTLHIYAQPVEDAYLQAQQEYAAQHPWFHVRRLDGDTHFPMLERPTDVATEVNTFVRDLAVLRRGT